MILVNLVIGVLLPFIGTVVGSSLVFMLRKDISNTRVEKLFLGFASGVILASVYYSLLGPAAQLASLQSQKAWLLCACGFSLGLGSLLCVDVGIACWGKHNKRNEQYQSKLMFWGISIHNIPQGMAIGGALAGFLLTPHIVSFGNAFFLSLGIAIQNIPEGSIVSLPIHCLGKTKKEAFFAGVVSGLIELASTMFTLMIAPIVIPFLPVLLAFAAGSMVYVLVTELIPQSQNGKYKEIAILGIIIGFCIMMTLDIILG